MPSFTQRVLLMGGLFILWGFSPVFAQTQGSAAITFDDSGLKSLFVGISSHFNVPETVVERCRSIGLPTDELAVCFQVAVSSGMKPEAVAQLRLGGQSWQEITTHCHQTTEIYYVPIAFDPGPPYGKAYGHYKKRHRSEWKTIVLEDDDIINLANLKLMTEHFGTPPEAIIRMRAEGKTFAVISNEEGRKKGQKASQKSSKDGKGQGKKPGKSGGKGKGNGSGKGKNK